MRMGKYGHELDLLLLLTENKDYSTSELAEKLNITRRNLYYYLDYLKCSGFHLIKTEPSIDLTVLLLSLKNYTNLSLFLPKKPFIFIANWRVWIRLISG